jgi:hypothetical protein
MTARSPAAAAPKAVETAALPVEAVVIVSIPLRRPSSITSAVARSLFDVVGLRVSSLTHRRGVPASCRRAGTGSSGVPPIGSGYRTGPSGTGSRSRYRHIVKEAGRSCGTSAGP